MRNSSRYIWIVGPDGCGKSTLAASLASSSSAVIRYWRPGVLPLAKQVLGRAQPVGINTRPHDRLADGPLKALARGVYYCADYIVGHQLLVRRALAQGHDVIIDRGWADMLVDHQRYGFASSRIPKLLLTFIPKPDVIIVVNVDSKTAHARKPELPVEEIDRQYAEWRNLKIRGTSIVQVDNEASVTESTKQLSKLLHGLTA